MHQLAGVLQAPPVPDHHSIHRQTPGDSHEYLGVGVPPTPDVGNLGDQADIRRLDRDIAANKTLIRRAVTASNSFDPS